MTTARQRALVTGASSGIGLEFAVQLARAGFDLVVVARRHDRLEALAQRLRSSVNVDVLTADLSQSEDVAKIEARLSQQDDAISLLVNNAGFGGYRPFIQLEPEQADALIRLMVLTPTRLVRAVLPGMIGRGSGAIINVASLLALSGTLPPVPGRLPARATYAGTKSYIVTFTQTLAHELAGTGVKVQVCLPGLVSTEFLTVQGIDAMQLPPMMSAADLVAGSLAGLAQDEVICVPGLDDAAMFGKIGEAQRAVLMAGNKQGLAPRYGLTL